MGKNQCLFLVSHCMKLKNAVWDCGNDKSPWPDGFSFGFVKRFWDILKEDFKAVSQHFFVHMRISKGCSSTFIALIPKISDPQSFNYYQPVSLIGAIYKVITKVLANRGIWSSTRLSPSSSLPSLGKEIFWMTQLSYLKPYPL